MTGWRIIVFFVFITSSLYAQDTLRINLRQADSLLIERNLTLIAGRYDVGMAEAAEIQARLFSNPELSTEWNLHNPSKRQWLDAGRSGQKIISLQSVFRIAGQRNIAVRLAEEQTRMTELEYEGIVRSLRYELHVSFFRYFFLSRAVSSIDSQLRLLQNLIRVYGEQYEKGNISLQELTRLNTTYFSINKQLKAVQQEQIRLQEILQTLLFEDRFVMPENADTLNLPPIGITVDDLVARAIEKRPELKIAQSQQQQYHLRYTLARKQAIPNITAGIVYDQAGSYVNDYTAITLGLQIPVFHRNQGEIQAAKIGISRGQTVERAVRQKIKKEVESAWLTFQLLWNQYNEVGEEHEAQLNQLSEGLITNYSKNNLSLLEFTDLFEAYNTNIIQYNELKADLNQSYEELVYAVGEDIRN